jgi:hypothetical protein
VLFFEIGLDDDSLEIPRCRRWGDTALDLFELGRGSTPASIAMVAIVVLSSETFLRCASVFWFFWLGVFLLIAGFSCLLEVEDDVSSVSFTTMFSATHCFGI